MIDLNRERELLNRRVLGWSLACEFIEPGIDLGRDIRLVQTAKGLDLASVSGMDNLAQVLEIALTTRLGDDLFNVQFGFDGLNALAEETNAVLMRERIRIAVILVLRKDPRIRRIVDVKLEDGRLEEPVPGGSRQLEVRVAFETVSGEQASINLGRVVTNG